MRKHFLTFAGLIAVFAAIAQNPATVFNIPNRNITLPCGTNCTNFSVQVPHIKQSTNYVITNPAYLPYAYSSPTGTELTSIYQDDKFSSAIAFPFAFSFCFYGINYNSVVIGSNSILTFDVTNANLSNSWPLTTSFGSGSPVPMPYSGGSQNSAGSTYYPKASIMGPYHDIYPTNTANGQRRIEYRVEGNAPYRRFITSYKDVPMFDCESMVGTNQIVIYENTGIVEVYIKNKPVCIDWNLGLAILGVQDATQTKAVTAPGKNATVWGGNYNLDSCFRFIPSGGASLFKKAELLVNNVVVSTNTTDTSTASPGVLNLNFPNVCPTADSTAYAIRVWYGSCSNPAFDVSFTDTVFVKRNTLAATVQKTDATCSTNGVVTVTATGGTAPIQYSINNGNTYQSSNTFSNVAPGNYTVVTRDASNCSISQALTIALTGAVSVNAGTDTTICNGASFSRSVISNATATTTFSWSPTTGLSSSSIPNPVFAPSATTQYTVTMTTGLCTAQDVVVVNVVPGATASAGVDAVIMQGQQYQMQASASPGNYTWTPAGGLSASNILNPIANPATTTTYTLKVTTGQGCIAEDNMTLTVVPYCIKPMEAFTPNGDGVNDLWLITNGSGCLERAKAQVFNRYGAKVFESNDYKNNWNGTYNGKPLADGTYYYVITFKLITGKEEYMKGSLTILR